MSKINFFILGLSFFYACNNMEKKPEGIIKKPEIVKVILDSTQLKKECVTDSVKIIDEFERIYIGVVGNEPASLSLKKIGQPNLYFIGEINFKNKKIKLIGWLYGCNDFNDSIRPHKVKNELGYLELPLKWNSYENSTIERVNNNPDDGYVYEFLRLIDSKGQEDSLQIFGRFINNKIYRGSIKSSIDSIPFSFTLSKEISKNGKKVRD